ncbi:hypothetical protein IQ260_10195 [Leptolyngbya cf. ectocarpi LEGE 11479]|uniref:Uncharacterized protein n=1 Tax=Leptolyngbya cf. ectocarpi LEGE 11479 TaxID=1828722 RepID=A0A928X3D6_LEPEC|nr:hypothetical protein [Leptolyngbya ectocarpi]MBE9067026.1 hypothetical protein [Leptolyngbya cf. ectocarpi LEGE 11479]
MPYQGFIEPNAERLDDFIRAVVTVLAREQARLALWLIEEFTFNHRLAATTIIGTASPFPSSGSKLAGVGYLMPIQSDTVAALVAVLICEDQLDCYIMHLEIEVAGNIAIAAYDTFSCVFFNAPITLAFLEDLRQQAIIDNYGLCEPSG